MLATRFLRLRVLGKNGYRHGVLPSQSPFFPSTLKYVLGTLAALAPLQAICAEPVDFTRDIRPILSRHCFKCHGPDDKARKAKLRLDLRNTAFGEAKSGLRAIVPGKPAESELVRRIFSVEDGEIMPPPSIKNPLTEPQKQVLKRWVAAGA